MVIYKMGECYGILWDRVLRSDGFTVIMGGIQSSCHCFCCFTYIFASLLLRAGLMIVVEFLLFFQMSAGGDVDDFCRGLENHDVVLDGE